MQNLHCDAYTDPFPHIVIHDFYDDEELKLIWEELNFYTKPGKLVNADKQPITDLIGNGSKVKVQYHEWETSNQFGDFKGLDFQAMQVIDLVPYGDRDTDGAAFGIDDGDEF